MRHFSRRQISPTTLWSDGLNQQDASSHCVAASKLEGKAWAPAFASELAMILERSAPIRCPPSSVITFLDGATIDEKHAQPDFARWRT